MEKKKKGMLDYVIVILFAIIFIACIVGLLIIFIKGQKAEKQVEEVRNTYVSENAEEESTEETPEPVSTEESLPAEPEATVDEETPDYVMIDGVVYPDFAGLDMPERAVDIEGLQREINDDIYAWVYIPDTNVDYPILQHPTDNDYYLNHDMAGNKVTAGSIFTQNYNDKDFNDNHTVIYGHNMKNGSMFKSLHYYMEEEFFAENPYIYIYLEDETRVYQVFGAYEYGDMHLLLNYDTEDEAVFENYITEVKGISDSAGHFDRSVEVSSKDKIITLSTCIGGKPDKRYLVQAKLIAVECEEEA